MKHWLQHSLPVWKRYFGNEPNNRPRANRLALRNDSVTRRESVAGPGRRARGGAQPMR